MVRRIAMSARLVLHQHDQPGDDVERRDEHDQGQDDEHDVALDLERREEGAVALAPVGQDHRPLGGHLDRLARLVDAVGVVEEDLDHGDVVLAVEIGLRLLERHEDEGGVELGHAELEDGVDLVSFDPGNDAERPLRALRRRERDGVADLQREVLGEALADRDAAVPWLKSLRLPWRTLPETASILPRSSGRTPRTSTPLPL